MDLDVTQTNEWIYRRFFLSNIRSASRVFCCNTSHGFTFGQINLDKDELRCEHVDSNHFGFQINHLCWLPNTIYRPSRKEIKIALTTLSTSNHQQPSMIYHSDNNNSTQKLKCLDDDDDDDDKTSVLTVSSIDYNEWLDRIAISYLNGTIKVYRSSQDNEISYKTTLSNDGVLHKIEWNPVKSSLLLLGHSYRVNIFDVEREMIELRLSKIETKEHLADCTWKSNDIIVGRHRQQMLIWDKRASREPIRNEILDICGHIEKLKCSLASPNHLLSVYDSRLCKIKIYDFRYLTMRQVECFDQMSSSSFLDYHWTIDQMAIVVGTHEGLLHWIDVDVPLNSKILNKIQ